MTSRFCIVALLGVLPILARAADVDFPTEIPDEPFDIRAAKIEYTNGFAIASGGVTARFENMQLQADQLTCNRDTGDMKLKGNIFVERDNVIWQGSELDYNYITQTGIFGPSTLEFEPVLMSVDHIERVSTNEYYLRGAEFTTCAEEYPHFHVRAEEAQLLDEKYLKAKKVVVYIGKIPVFYLPRWNQKLGKSIFKYKVGFSSEWGAFGLIKAKVPVTQGVNWISDVNIYGKRGVGLGQGLEWNQVGIEGGISGFYLDDRDPYVLFSTPEDQAAIGPDRYRFNFEHVQHFSQTHYVNTDLSYLSDPAVVQEFFKSEYRRSPQPENYASWTLSGEQGGTEAFVSKRLNNFYDNVDRAEYSADLYRSRIPGTPFYMQSENSIAHLERASGTPTNSIYDSVRVDSANLLTLQQRIGFINVVPYAGYRATYYSKTPVADQSDEVRQIPSAGMEVSFHVAKILSEQNRWYGNGLRHKIEPYADYTYADSSISTNRLFQFDAYDALDDENRIKLGLRNVLQTRRGGHVKRFIDLDLYTYYLADKDGAPENFEDLFIDARIPLTTHTKIDLEGRYDWYDENVPLFNSRISHVVDDIIFSLEHLYQDKTQSLWTPRIDLFPEGKLSFDAYARYDDNENDLQEISVAGYVNWCCMRYGLGSRFYDDGEYSILFSIGLSAFPEARISSGM